MINPDSLLVFKNEASLMEEAAELVSSIANDSVSAKGFFSLVLSGGSTPKELYRILASDTYRSFPWENTFIFFGDERCVSPKDSFSNYYSAHEVLLSKVPIPEHQIYRIKGENMDTEFAADEYADMIRDFFSAKKGAHGTGFDLVLLGIGADGHTASIFPGSPSMYENIRLVIPVNPPENAVPRIERITMTLPLINTSSHVLFLVTGTEKKEVFSRINSPEKTDFPAAKVNPEGNLYWYVTEDIVY